MRDPVRLLHAFATTRYRVRTGRGWLELRPGRRAPALEAALPRAAAFALLTAFNPGGRRRGRAANLRADAALEAALRAGGESPWRSLAGVGRPRWLEPGWLLARPAARAEGLDADVDVLARRFRQAAVLHWRRGAAGRCACACTAPGRAACRFAWWTWRLHPAPPAGPTARGRVTRAAGPASPDSRTAKPDDAATPCVRSGGPGQPWSGGKNRASSGAGARNPG